MNIPKCYGLTMIYGVNDVSAFWMLIVCVRLLWLIYETSAHLSTPCKDILTVSNS